MFQRADLPEAVMQQACRTVQHCRLSKAGQGRQLEFAGKAPGAVFLRDESAGHRGAELRNSTMWRYRRSWWQRSARRLFRKWTWQNRSLETAYLFFLDAIYYKMREDYWYVTKAACCGPGDHHGRAEGHSGSVDWRVWELQILIECVEWSQKQGRFGRISILCRRLVRDDVDHLGGVSQEPFASLRRPSDPLFHSPC